MSSSPHLMPESFYDPDASIRQTIASHAARLIAEDGMDYGSAKRKAARELFGNRRVAAHAMPDNQTVEDEVRIYQELFHGDTQPQRLRALRQTALELMQLLRDFKPYLIGAVFNGTAGAHSDIHLELFTDSVKDVEMFLLQQKIFFEVDEKSQASRSSNRLEPIESLHFVWHASESRESEGVHLMLFDTGALRGSMAGEQRGKRCDKDSLLQLLAKHPDDKA